MRKNEMIKIEFNEFDEIIQNSNLIDSNIEFEKLESEIRNYDYLMNQLEIRLNRDFDFYNQNQISRKDEDFEIYLESEYNLYYDRENNDFHYFLEISDIDNEDYKIFSIEIFDIDNLDNIYEIIKNYIYYLIDYNKKIFDEEN